MGQRLRLHALWKLRLEPGVQQTAQSPAVVRWLVANGETRQTATRTAAEQPPPATAPVLITVPQILRGGRCKQGRVQCAGQTGCSWLVSSSIATPPWPVLLNRADCMAEAFMQGTVAPKCGAHLHARLRHLQGAGCRGSYRRANPAAKEVRPQGNISAALHDLAIGNALKHTQGRSRSFETRLAHAKAPAPSFSRRARNATASRIACWCTRSKNNSGTNSLEVVAGLSAGSCSTWGASGTWWTPPSKLGLFCANRRIARTRQPPSMPRAPLMLGFHHLHPTSCARKGQATQRSCHRTQQQLLPKRSLHSATTLSTATWPASLLLPPPLTDPLTSSPA